MLIQFKNLRRAKDYIKLFNFRVLTLYKMIFADKKNTVFTILAGLFITNAITAELIGAKLIHIGPFIMSIEIGRAHV